jgi:hypothetical protein
MHQLSVGDMTLEAAARGFSPEKRRQARTARAHFLLLLAKTCLSVMCICYRFVYILYFVMCTRGTALKTI